MKGHIFVELSEACGFSVFTAESIVALAQKYNLLPVGKRGKKLQFDRVHFRNLIIALIASPRTEMNRIVPQCCALKMWGQGETLGSFVESIIEAQSVAHGVADCFSSLEITLHGQRWTAVVSHEGRVTAAFSDGKALTDGPSLWRSWLIPPGLFQLMGSLWAESKAAKANVGVVVS